MTAVLLYIFVFSSWGLGLLSLMIGLNSFIDKRELEKKEKLLEITQKQMLLDHLSNMSKLSGGKGQLTQWGKVNEPEKSQELIPEKLRELMASSPNHPEVEEIDGSDQILGVKFEARDYPPVFGDGEDEE